MSRRFVALLATAGLLATAFLVVPAIVVAGDPCWHTFDNRPAPTSGKTSQITLGDCVFTPTITQVPTGSTVTWRNSSMQEHEVVGSNMTWGAHDKLLSQGDTIGWTFETAGVYAYSCLLHPGMTGVVVVGDAAEAAAAAPVAATASSEDAADGSGDVSTPVVGLAAGVGGLAVGLFLARVLRRDPVPDA